MINIAIVDDDFNFLKLLEKKLISLDCSLTITCYTNTNDFIENINNFNCVLLDIAMPQINGISLSKQLRNYEISIFFITIHEELMIKAFGKNVEGFVRKDKLEEDLIYFIKFIKNYHYQKYIDCTSKYGSIKIKLNDILYINYCLRDIEYYLKNGKKIIQKNKNLKEIINNLDNNFVQINRSNIININYVEKLLNDCLLIHGNKLKVSRRKLKNLKIKLFEKELYD